jgi:hypothetical protein
VRFSERFQDPKLGGLEPCVWRARAIRIHACLAEPLLDLVQSRLKRSDVFERLNFGRLKLSKQVVYGCGLMTLREFGDECAPHGRFTEKSPDPPGLKRRRLRGVGRKRRDGCNGQAERQPEPKKGGRS